ncbi:peptide chain release factor-like protein, mitochondrial [Phlyctema vagabunda]|uniref:Peptide chain release factor-like protein, mitochondrial n=1 Tax=Phlyctema vagabunda TaxID=108571 RepID=A0ABR4PQH0_9HELO
MIQQLLSSFGRASEHVLRSSIARRAFTISTSPCAKAMPPRPRAISEHAFTEKFLCGTGPGGQKINKTSSAVQLKHLETGTVLKVQATRSRTQNRKIARQMLAERLEILEKGSESRAAKVGEIKRKKKSSATKKSKRKYKLLAEAKESEAGQQKDGGAQ